MLGLLRCIASGYDTTQFHLDQTVEHALDDDDDALLHKAKERLAIITRRRTSGTSSGTSTSTSTSTTSSSTSNNGEKGAEGGRSGAPEADEEVQPPDTELRSLLCDELLRLNGARVLSRKDVASIWSWSPSE